MKIIKMKKYDDTPIINEKPISERIPHLDEGGERFSPSHKQLAWCHGFMDNHKDGQTFFIESHGIHLQRISDNIARCIAIIDNPLSYEALAMMWQTFEKSGILFQTDPYTITLLDEPAKDEMPAEDIAGIEVV